MAGVFFAFSTFVMPGLAKIPPKAGIAAMQSLNLSVPGSLFGVLFIITPVICLIVMVLAGFKWEGRDSLYILAAGIVYLATSFLVTIFFNIPLNDALVSIQSDSSSAVEFWTKYQNDWVFWNHIRTLGSIISTVFFALALR